MHPSTQKGIDFGRRCSHCIAEVGRQKLMTCGRCHRTRYCSKACQKDAWKRHKITCKSVAEAQAEIADSNIGNYEVLDRALKKWTQCWTFALNRWACVGMDLPNHAPNRASTHCCVVRLKRRPNPPTPAQAFVMTTAQIMSNGDFLKALWTEIGPTREEFSKLKQEAEVRENDEICLVIFCEGLANFKYFKLLSLDIHSNLPRETIRTISSAAAKGWANNLIHLVEEGNALKEASDKLLSYTTTGLRAPLTAHSDVIVLSM